MPAARDLDIASMTGDLLLPSAMNRRRFCWPTRADRIALRHGDGDDTSGTDASMAAWRAALGLSALAALAPRPATRPQALGRLRDLRMTLTYVQRRS